MRCVHLLKWSLLIPFYFLLQVQTPFSLPFFEVLTEIEFKNIHFYFMSGFFDAIIPMVAHVNNLVGVCLLFYVLFLSSIPLNRSSTISLSVCQQAFELFLFEWFPVCEYDKQMS